MTHITLRLGSRGVKLSESLAELAAYKVQRRKKEKAERERLVSQLLRLVEILPAQVFLASQTIPALRRAGVKPISIKKISKEAGTSEGRLRGLLFLSTATGHLTPFTCGAKPCYAVSPLGELFKDVAREFREDPRAVALTFTLSSLLVPTRVQLFYFAMKGAGTDKPDDLYSTLHSKVFAGEIKRYRLLYLDVLQEMYYTDNFREKDVKTPSEFAYEFAKRLDTVVDFETFKTVFICAKGVQEGFDYLFRGAYCREEVFEAVEPRKRGEVLRKLVSEAGKRAASIDGLLSRIYYF